MNLVGFLFLLVSVRGFAPRSTNRRRIGRTRDNVLGVSTGFGGTNRDELDDIWRKAPDYVANLRNDKQSSILDAYGGELSADGSGLNRIGVEEEEITTYDPRRISDSTNTESFQVSLSFEASSPPVGMLLIDGTATERILDMDTLQVTDQTREEEVEVEEDSGMSRMSRIVSARSTSDDVQGILVAYVQPGGQAEAAGIKVGDMLVKTSATIGDGMWPKGNIEGVKASLLSRLAVTKQASVLISRPTGEVTTVEETFSLTLKRPIGVQLRQVEAANGRREVVVSEVATGGVNSEVLQGLKVGDKVLAVEAALGGKLWPHTTVDGVVAAVNGRLPGTTVNIRFSRTVEVGGFVVPDVASNPESSEAIDDTLKQTVKSFKVLSEGSSLAPTGSKTHKILLSRSRSILANYVSNHVSNKDSKDYMLPSLAASKVLTVLAEADAQLDAGTLKQVMEAYLRCRDSEGAINAFTASTGLMVKKGDKEDRR